MNKDELNPEILRRYEEGEKIADIHRNLHHTLPTLRRFSYKVCLDYPDVCICRNVLTSKK